MDEHVTETPADVLSLGQSWHLNDWVRMSTYAWHGVVRSYKGVRVVLSFVSMPVERSRRLSAEIGPREILFVVVPWDATPAEAGNAMAKRMDDLRAALAGDPTP